jgi:proteasome lid subunit RPN8/RPN11
MLQMSDSQFQIIGHTFDVPFRRRSHYRDYVTFRVDELDVCLARDAAQMVRDRAAETAPREAGGLLVGRVFRDDGGQYVVVTGAVCAPLEAGRVGSFALSARGTDALRSLAAAVYPSADTVGWWHSHGRPSHFSTTDRRNQAVWKDPHDLGLLVFATGRPWALMYAGPDSRGGVPPTGDPLTSEFPASGAEPARLGDSVQAATQPPVPAHGRPRVHRVPADLISLARLVITAARRLKVPRLVAVPLLLGMVILGYGLLTRPAAHSGPVTPAHRMVSWSCAMSAPDRMTCSAHGPGKLEWFVSGKRVGSGPAISFTLPAAARSVVSLVVTQGHERFRAGRMVVSTQPGSVLPGIGSYSAQIGCSKCPR